jgi:hypothetical protein
MRVFTEQQAQEAARAEVIWAGMDKNERAGVRFGLFPAGKMHEAEKEGFDSHGLVCALMDCAQRAGGMLA